MNDDVPSPIDLRDADDAATWASTAMSKRPYRAEVFAAIAASLRDHHAERVLELGSGPGFLAAHLLDALDDVTLVALDFSDAMHALARARTAQHGERFRTTTRDFLDDAWTTGLGGFDAVVTMQAVHELRHVRRATTLHRQVRRVLAEDGLYLVCDHVLGPRGMTNAALYMTIDAQAEALRAAGFARVSRVLAAGSLVLHAATSR